MCSTLTLGSRKRIAPLDQDARLAQLRGQERIQPENCDMEPARRRRTGFLQVKEFSTGKGKTTVVQSVHTNSPAAVSRLNEKRPGSPEPWHWRKYPPIAPVALSNRISCRMRPCASSTLVRHGLSVSRTLNSPHEATPASFTGYVSGQTRGTTPASSADPCLPC
jgi:hypothetical protein